MLLASDKAPGGTKHIFVPAEKKIPKIRDAIQCSREIHASDVIFHNTVKCRVSQQDLGWVDFDFGRSTVCRIFCLG